MVNGSADPQSREQFIAETVNAVAHCLRVPSPDLLSPGALVDTLRRNQVPILSLLQVPRVGSSSSDSSEERALTRQVEYPVLTTPEFKAALDADCSVYNTAYAHYRELVTAWNDAGIRCLCHKSAGIFPSFPYTSDNIDVLVPPSAVETARRILLDLHYVELRNAEEPEKWLFRRFAGGRSISAIHLHARVGWSEGFMLESELWRRAGPSPDDPLTWVPGPEDAVLVNIAHGLVENKNLSLHDLLKVRQALSSGPIDWLYMDHVARERGWLLCLHFGLLLCSRLEQELFDRQSIPESERTRFAETVEGAPWLARYAQALPGPHPALPFDISFRVSKQLFFSKVWADRALTSKEKAVGTVLALARGVKQKSGIRPQQSMLFALSGVDGSGKSVQCESLTEAFTTCAIRSQRVWSRIGSTPLLFTLHRIRYGRLRSSGHSTVADFKIPKSLSRSTSYSRNGFRLSLWMALAVLDYAAQLQYIRWCLLRGRVVFADRYLCDADVEIAMHLRDRPSVATGIMRLLRWTAPSPDREYLIRIDPATSIRRDPPLPDEPERGDIVEAYDYRASQLGMVVIDGNRPHEDVASSVVHDALTLYLGRFRPLSNILFFDNDWQLNPGGSPLRSRHEKRLKG